jgi:transcriptional regulator with XRE-family HTH domain
MRAQALVARNLRRLRVERGLAQEALAADAGIDRTYVSRLERGLENPTVAILEQLANALDTKIVDFLVVPRPDEPLPKPLRGGRRPKR